MITKEQQIFSNIDMKNFSQEIILSTKSNKAKGMKITTSADAHREFSFIWDSDINIRERMKAFYLNTANEIIGFYEVSSGGVAGTIADIRLILAPALLCGASGIILGHNHPSGNLAPSKADIDLTKKIKDAAKLLNTDLLDHIILTETSYSSFADEGLL